MKWDFASNGFVHLCGHRGHSAGAPENTLAALRRNRMLGGTTAEIDAVLTADGQIVVLHDLSVDRTTNGSGIVADMTLAELQTLDAGGWFGAEFKGERVPTLAQTLSLAGEIGLGLEIEIKERRDVPRFAKALAALLEDPAVNDRVMVISFDHVSLHWLKTQIPGIRTGGIIHARHADPVDVAASAGLDELCIDLAVWHPEDARRLHAAGVVNRCHAYAPATIERIIRAGLDPRPGLRDSLSSGLIDTLSGDDVGWLARLALEVGVAPAMPVP